MAKVAQFSPNISVTCPDDVVITLPIAADALRGEYLRREPTESSNEIYGHTNKLAINCH